MSQKVKITTSFKELKPLLSAFDVLGWTVSKNVVARGWNDNKIHDLVAAHPSTTGHSGITVTDLIIDKGPKSYEVHTSMDGDYAERVLATLGGRSLNKLKRTYATESIRMVAEENDNEVTVKELENGTLEVTVNEY